MTWNPHKMMGAPLQCSMFLTKHSVFISPLVHYFIVNTLIHILLRPKVISLCHQYRATPAGTSVQSDQALYCWLTN